MSVPLSACPRCGDRVVRTDEIRRGATCPHCLATVEVGLAAVVLCNAVLLAAVIVPFQAGSSLGFLGLSAYALFVLRQEWFTTRYFPLKVYGDG